MVALDLLEVFALFPANVIVQGGAGAAEKLRVTDDGVSLFDAAACGGAEKFVLLEQALAQRGIAGQGEEDALLIVEVLADFRVPRGDEARDGFAAEFGVVRVGGAGEAARLDEAVHVLAREGLQRGVALERGGGSVRLSRHAGA